MQCTTQGRGARCTINSTPRTPTPQYNNTQLSTVFTAASSVSHVLPRRRGSLHLEHACKKLGPLGRLERAHHHAHGAAADRLLCDARRRADAHAHASAIRSATTPAAGASVATHVQLHAAHIERLASMEPA